jgi:hypothetical protein
LINSVVIISFDFVECFAFEAASFIDFSSKKDIAKSRR